jgi:putative membrane protein
MYLLVLSSLALLAGPSHPANPTPAHLNDATIVAIFDAANTFDIETGSLGSTKGNSKEARAVGEALVRDHTSVRAQGRDLARKLGVTPTPPAENPFAASHAKTMAELKAKQGTEFDRAFLDAEIAYHQAVIDAVTKTLLPAVSNAELRAFVEKVAPAFQAHLDMVKATKAQLKL